MVSRRVFQGGDTPAWRKKKVRNLALQKKKKGEDSDDMPGEDNDTKNKKKKSKKV